MRRLKINVKCAFHPIVFKFAHNVGVCNAYKSVFAQTLKTFDYKVFSLRFKLFSKNSCREINWFF